MAPKGGNAKKEGGRAKKAENEVSAVQHLNSLCHANPEIQSFQHGSQRKASCRARGNEGTKS
jgi:hypothetical protein